MKNFVSVASPILLACIVLENTPQAQTTKTVKQPTKTAKSDNRIEELTKLKDLLDTGVITQEEFDAKKTAIEFVILVELLKWEWKIIPAPVLSILQRLKPLLPEAGA